MPTLRQDHGRQRGHPKGHAKGHAKGHPKGHAKGHCRAPFIPGWGAYDGDMEQSADTCQLHGRRTTTAFTLIELLTVLAIIAILSGIVMAAVPALQRQSRLKASQMLVASVAMAIQAYPSAIFTVWTPVAAGGGGTDYAAASFQLWDWNGDGILDGRPDLEPGTAAPLIAAATKAGYVGFLDSNLASMPASSVESATHRIVDSWRRPLHIAFAAGHYSGGNVGIWSLGLNSANGVDLGTADDAYDIVQARERRGDAAWLKAHPSADNLISWGQ